MHRVPFAYYLIIIHAHSFNSLFVFKNQVTAFLYCNINAENHVNIQGQNDYVTDRSIRISYQY